MSLAAEVDALHDLCELEQRLRPEVQREVVANVAGVFTTAHAATSDRIVQVCRALLAKASE